MRRGPRCSFSAAAEIGSFSGILPARVTELSLHGCYLESIAGPLPRGTDVTLKIVAGNECFEAVATVLYCRPTLGVGLGFRAVKPDFLLVLERWLNQSLDFCDTPSLKIIDAAPESKN